MKNKKLMAQIVLKNGKPVQDLENEQLFFDGSAVKLARLYEKKGADALIIHNVSKESWEKEKTIRVIREICLNIDIPVIAGGNIEETEEIERLLQTGCRKAFFYMSMENTQMLERISGHFEKEKIAVCITDFSSIHSIEGSLALLEQSVSLVLMFGDNFHLYDAASRLPMETVPILSFFYFEQVLALLRLKNVAGISGKVISDINTDLFELRKSFVRQGISLQNCVSNFEWKDLKTNSDGLVPVIVQDYKNEQVLMMAYMNQEAFEMTLLTGRMTYFSRSRQSLWLKGETSGHFQYVKQILIDCDNDTLVAKVEQKGAACHTGNRTCFYRELVKKRYKDANPLTMFENVMTEIRRQKECSAEGVYVNGIFDEDLDQILQKAGESFIGLTLAAKNRDKEAACNGIYDQLFQMMMIMDQLGISWSDIAHEYKKR